MLALPNDAGWSSLVARRAHNPKVAGSNPAPATSERPANAGLSSFTALVPDPARVHLEMVREHPAPPGTVRETVRGRY